MQTAPASPAPQAPAAKLPWETPLCQPLDAAEGTEETPNALESIVVSTAPAS